MSDDPMEDYDESVDITTDADRLADEFAELEKEEAALVNYVWPPRARKLIKQKCSDCGGPVHRVRDEQSVYDWCFECDAQIE
jgi:hypothetical protein